MFINERNGRYVACSGGRDTALRIPLPEMYAGCTKRVDPLNLSSLVTVSVALSHPRVAKAKPSRKSYECKASRFVWKFFDGKRAGGTEGRLAETLSMERGGKVVMEWRGARGSIRPCGGNARWRLRFSPGPVRSGRDLGSRHFASLAERGRREGANRNVGWTNMPANFLFVPPRSCSRSKLEPLAGINAGGSGTAEPALPSHHPVRPRLGGGCFKISGWRGGVMP